MCFYGDTKKPLRGLRAPSRRASGLDPVSWSSLTVVCVRSVFNAKGVPVNKIQRKTFYDCLTEGELPRVPRRQSEDNMGGPERRMSDHPRPPEGTEMLESNQEKDRKFCRTGIKVSYFTITRKLTILQ